jgi:pimeloyl-ACP methyl ester carboxylesterase
MAIAGRALLRSSVVLSLVAATGCTGDDDRRTATPAPSATATAAPTATKAERPPPRSATATERPAATPTAKPEPKPQPATTAALRRYYTQRPKWTDCDDGFECTRVLVPLDYDKPTGPQIGIATIRLRASDRERRIGSLVLNPGGPGGSGVSYARYARQVLSRSVRQRFDVVGFDPRGVGDSSPVRCLTGPRLDRWLAADPSPDSAKELATLVAANKVFARGCQQRSARLLPNVGTRDAARDIDILRAALGDKQLTYLGKSYGTVLGAVYAELFPANVRALVLDGAVDPSIGARELAREQAVGFERALAAFLRSCAKDTSCAFRGNGRLGERFDALMAEIESAPLPTSLGGRTLGPGEATLGVVAPLYNRRSGWPALGLGLAEAERGDGTILLRLFDGYVERRSGGSYDNLMEANYAVNCIDRPVPKQPAELAADARVFAEQAPRFGAVLAYGALACAYWPVPPVDRPARVVARGAPPILVIGTTRDPATPMRWSESLAEQLESGVLLIHDGDGHTAYGNGVACVDDTADAYLISLKVPKDGRRC